MSEAYCINSPDGRGNHKWRRVFPYEECVNCGFHRIIIPDFATGDVREVPK